MRFLSVCSGIEAASVAWSPLGWEAVAFSEIEAFPSSVLAHHYPDVPNVGDMNEIAAEDYRGAIDLLVGGTPCQSFSVAGLRAGMADPRGGLALRFLELARDARPLWVVWENVPGVLSSNGGRDFGAFLGGLGELGYGFAYRVLDAQYFGLAQRRRRVFVVGCLGDWRRAAAVLLEQSCLRGDPAPSREAGARVAALSASGVGTCGADDNQAQGGRLIAFHSRQDPIHSDKSLPLEAKGGQAVAGPIYYSHDYNQDRVYGTGGPSEAATVARRPNIFTSSGVRRLTPTECERLMGFPDGYTSVPYRGKPASDGPRYRALGNSMAVPVMRWIGERLSKAIKAAQRAD